MTGVYYDAQGIQSVDHPERGIARYVRELAIALTEVAPGLVTGFVHDPQLPRSEALSALAERAPLLRNDDPALADARVFHVASPFELGRAGRALVPLAVRGRARLVATLYDLIPLGMPSAYLPSGIERALYRRSVELVRACDALVAISQATADDAQRLLGVGPERITVIGAGASDIFRPPTDPIADVHRALDRAVPGLRPGHVLAPIGMDPRKNWQGTIEAFAALPAAVRAGRQLVLACRVDDEQRARVAAVAAPLGVHADVVLTGVVSDATLVRLYQTAHVVLFPSRYEGFGLPPLEARLCGAPVICGDNSSLREVVPDPRARFDADRTTAITAALARVLSDDAFRRELVEAPVPPFTWRLAAERTAARYRELLGRPQRHSARLVGVVAGEDTDTRLALAHALTAVDDDVVVFADLDGPSPFGLRRVLPRRLVGLVAAAGELRALARVDPAPAPSTERDEPPCADVTLDDLGSWLRDVAGTTVGRGARGNLDA